MASRHGARVAEQDVAYRPAEPIAPGCPLFRWPPRPRALAGWLLGFPGFLWPWKAVHVAIAILTWLYLTPGLDTVRRVAPGWIGWLLLRNALLLVLVASAWHLWFYRGRRQGSAYKYNPLWPDAQGRKATFLFGRQHLDNAVRSIASGVPVWTAYEALSLWLYGNGYVRVVAWGSHPFYCLALFALIPFWIAVHFYATHRLLHWRPLYRTIHHVHHKNINVGPWSGLAMHPLEHVIFFSAVVPLWLIPSHPLHAIFLLQFMALTAPMGHAGFDRIVVGSGSLKMGDYAHYLHHKYFQCNFGASGLIPLDHWMGTFHDGSDEATAAMRRRARAR